MPADDSTFSNDDEDLPILDLGDSNPWGVPDPAPTTLLAALESEQPPTLVEVHGRLGALVEQQVEIVGEPDATMQQALWSLTIKLGQHPVPVIIWVEEAIQELDAHPPFAANACWMVGAQTLLDPADPLQTWSRLITLLHDITGGMTALLDVETEQWFEGEEVAAHLQGEGATPEEGMLFRVHATSTAEQPETADSVWLRTVGLLRCGRPELELLEIPGKHVQIAHELLKALGALCIVRGVPDPGEPFEAGIGIDLSLQGWIEQAELLSPDSIGTRAHRVLLGGSEGVENSLLSGRAVVCGAERRGELREVFTWPIEAIERLERGEAAIERTRAWTAARSRDAQARWPILLEGLREGLLGRACVAIDVPAGGREHVWLSIGEADEERLNGQLLSTPASLPLEPGQQLETTVARVIDWALVRGATQ